MLAGGMTIAAPSMLPQAEAAGALFVSAENANFNNYFAGMQVVEIIVKDAKATEVDERQQEPTVKVDEHLLRLTQGADGYWYAYIADTTDVKTAWDANIVSDNHLHFGYLHGDGSFGSNSYTIGATPTFDAAATVYHSSDIIGGEPNLSCVDRFGTKDADCVGFIGQIGVDNTLWPFIQTFDFTIETFEIKLEKPGADEIVVLTHDNDDIDDYASIVLDRNAATNGAQVHATISDQALNIDPTTEDVVMFNVIEGDEGVSFKHIGGVASDHSYVAYDNSFDDNGKLIIDYDTNSSSISVLENTVTADDLTADRYLIFWETAENSGVFVNTDDDDKSNLKVKSTALRGTTATFD
jgi:hypothetical protein